MGLRRSREVHAVHREPGLGRADGEPVAVYGEQQVAVAVISPQPLLGVGKTADEAQRVGAAGDVAAPRQQPLVAERHGRLGHRAVADGEVAQQLVVAVVDAQGHVVEERRRREVGRRALDEEGEVVVAVAALKGGGGGRQLAHRQADVRGGLRGTKVNNGCLVDAQTVPVALRRHILLVGVALRQLVVAVVAAAPAPVEVVEPLSVIAVADEGMAGVAESRKGKTGEEHRAARGQLVVYQVVPCPGRVFVALGIVGKGVVAKVVGKVGGHGCRPRRAAVVHAGCLSAIAHQPGHLPGTGVGVGGCIVVAHQ